jgi:hypothetical protein
VKISTDVGVIVDREHRCCYHLVELGFGALCHVFVLPLLLGILRRVREQFLMVFRVLFQPVEKSFRPSYAPMNSMRLWCLLASLGLLTIGGGHSVGCKVSSLGSWLSDAFGGFGQRHGR